MTQTIEMKILTNAKQISNQLSGVNASLHEIISTQSRMHSGAVRGAKKSGSAMAGLALRFVGYQLVLNQVMGAQRKLYDYVAEGVTKFREFETRLAEVSTIMTEDFEGALYGMKAGIENLALSFGQNTSDLTKGLYDIMSAAFSAKDAMSLLAQATKASIAGLSEVRTSVDIFTTVLNTYGMSVYEATRVSDTLFQSVVRGKFQFAELESALGYVVPIAAQAGIAFDELMAALSTATRHGLHLDMASRGLAMGLQNIVNPSEGAAKAAEKYGIELSGLALRIKGISGVFGEMYQKTKDYGKIVLNELIPNIRSLRVAMVLAGEEGLEGMMDDLDRLSISAGRTEQALTKIKNTSQFASNIITQDWEKTQREVGQAWDALALNIQRGITDIVANAGNLLPVIGPIFTALDYQADKAMQTWRQAREERYLGKKLVSPLDAKITEQEIKDTKTALAEGEINFQQYTVKIGELQKKLETPMVSITAQNLKSNQDIMQDYLELQEEIADKGEEMNQEFIGAGGEVTDELKDMSAQLLILQGISSELGEDFNEVFGERVLGGIRNLENLRLSLDELSFDIIKLREKLEKPIEYGWAKTETGDMGPKGIIEGTLFYQKELLVSEQALADVRYDVKMGLADEEYGYKVLNAEMQNAILIVREHENAMKSDREAVALMNIELRLLNIQTMKIQLAGMMRRRGLTRSEEKMLKKLAIKKAQLRLKNIQETKNETKELHTDYFDKKAMLDDYVRSLENNTYQLKYSYDQQVKDLDVTIAYEQGLLEDRAKQWSDTTYEIRVLENQLSRDLKNIIADPDLLSAFDIIDIDIIGIRDNVKGLISDIDKLTAKTWPGKTTTSIGPSIATGTTTATKKILASGILSITPAGEMVREMLQGRGFQRGTEYIHETGPAWVHQGETIGAAGKDGDGGTYIENVNIQVETLADIDDPEKLAAVMSSAQNIGAINKRGKTRYGIR